MGHVPGPSAINRGQNRNRLRHIRVNCGTRDATPKQNRYFDKTLPTCSVSGNVQGTTGFTPPSRPPTKRAWATPDASRRGGGGESPRRQTPPPLSMDSSPVAPISGVRPTVGTPEKWEAWADAPSASASGASRPKTSRRVPLRPSNNKTERTMCNLRAVALFRAHCRAAASQFNGHFAATPDEHADYLQSADEPLPPPVDERPPPSASPNRWVRDEAGAAEVGAGSARVAVWGGSDHVALAHAISERGRWLLVFALMGGRIPAV